MGNPFKEVSSAVSEFAGDAADAWSKGHGKSDPSESKFLSYPLTLGNASSADSIDYNSADLEEGKDVKLYEKSSEVSDANLGKYAGDAEPFIMFQFMRQTEQEDYKSQITVLEEEDDHWDNKLWIDNFTVASWFADDVDDPISDEEEVQIEARQEMISKEIEEIKEKIGKRYINKTIALYMTPAIAVNDSMNYEQLSRKAAALAMDGEMGNLTAEDAYVGAAAAGEQVAAGVGYMAGKLIPKAGGDMISGALGYGIGSVVGDEMLRRMGKALNPNEYMQYKTTQLRTFSFNWKFLPDNKQESEDCTKIIKAFRAAAHAHRKSPITLTIPDQVLCTFHGVAGFPALPPLQITNVGVTYNPNAASFFKQNNQPVEIDFNVQLTEIVPIYRADVEKGY